MFFKHYIKITTTFIQQQASRREMVQNGNVVFSVHFTAKKKIFFKHYITITSTNIQQHYITYTDQSRESVNNNLFFNHYACRNILL